MAESPGPDGVYFLDRDGRHFHFILNFLRDGPELFCAPEDLNVCRELAHEAKALKLPVLLEALPNVRPKNECGNAMQQYTGAILPNNESSRLTRLEGLGVLHTDEHEHSYDTITTVVSALLDVPIVLVSLVAADFQWFKSRCGLEANSTSRSSSFCAYTFTPEEPGAASLLVIEDALRDERVAVNPLVLGEPYIRFYAGCPLVLSDGIRVGALCAIDIVPRSLTPAQAQVLTNFGQLATLQLENDQLVGGREPEWEPDDSEFLDGSPSFGAGNFRYEQMADACKQPTLLVWARWDNMDWPVLWGNVVWENATNMFVTPPKSFPGKPTVHGPGVPPTVQSRESRHLSLWDWIRLSKNESSEVLALWRQVRGTSPMEPSKSLSVQGKVSGSKGKGVSCRFSPAEQPHSASAAAVRPVPFNDGSTPPIQLRGWPPGRLYFVTVTMMLDTAPPSCAITPPASSREKPQPASTTSTTNIGSDTGRPSPTQTINCMKPPKSPFEDVRLLKMVGSGSFGSVFFGLWSGAQVAVKVIESIGQQSMNSDFEAALSVSLSHPNLVQTYKYSTREKKVTQAAGEEAPPPPPDTPQMETWIVQEWCDGGTLGKYCSKPRMSGTSLLEVIEIITEVAGAGAYLHSRGIIHGDLTGNNVLLKSQISRKGYVCKVCDFGLARILEGGTTEIFTKTMGTVTHMPPELFFEHLECVSLTAKVDVYALGILLWQALTGDQPFKGFSAAQVVVRVAKGRMLILPEGTPKDIADLYKLCTTADPKGRPDLSVICSSLEKLHLKALEGCPPEEQSKDITSGRCGVPGDDTNL